MSYIFKKGDIVRVKKVVGDDPSLMRENQVVESVKKIDVTDIDTYQVDLVGSAKDRMSFLKYAIEYK